MLPNPYVILAVVALFIGALVSGTFYGEHVQFNADQIAADALKLEAHKTLEAAQDEIIKSAVANAALKDQLESSYALHQKSIEADHARNATAIADLSRLRVASGCGPSGAGAVPVAGVAAGCFHGGSTIAGTDQGVDLVQLLADLNDAAAESESLANQVRAGQGVFAKKQ